MILKILERNVRMIQRTAKNLFLRPFILIKNKGRQFLNIGRYTAKFQKLFMSLLMKFKVKPKKRGDYVDVGQYFLAKSLLILSLVCIIGIPLLIYYFLWPFLVSKFFTAHFYEEHPKVSTYTGKVKLYYEEDKKQLHFEGRLVDGKKETYGEVYYQDGSLSYAGNFEQDYFQGEGTFYRADGLQYIGAFEKGKMQGDGKYYQSGTLVYEGEVVDGKKQGEGVTFSYPTGKLVHKGNYSEDTYSGEGTLYESEKVAYIGKFKEGLFEGDGKAYNTSGDLIYKGEFASGLYDGKGEWQDPVNKVRYTGDFVKGAKEGQASLLVDGLKYYEGSFKADELFGEGVFYDAANQLKYTGMFATDDIDMSYVLGKSASDVAQLFEGTAFMEYDGEEQFYLYNKGQGIVLDICYAEGEMPASVQQIHRIPWVYQGNRSLEACKTYWDQKGYVKTAEGSEALEDTVRIMLGIPQESLVYVEHTIADRKERWWFSEAEEVHLFTTYASLGGEEESLPENEEEKKTLDELLEEMGLTQELVQVLEPVAAPINNQAQRMKAYKDSILTNYEPVLVAEQAYKEAAEVLEGLKEALAVLLVAQEEPIETDIEEAVAETTEEKVVNTMDPEVKKAYQEEIVAQEAVVKEAKSKHQEAVVDAQNKLVMLWLNQDKVAVELASALEKIVYLEGEKERIGLAFKKGRATAKEKEDIAKEQEKVVKEAKRYQQMQVTVLEEWQALTGELPADVLANTDSGLSLYQVIDPIELQAKPAYKGKGNPVDMQTLMDLYSVLQNQMDAYTEYLANQTENPAGVADAIFMMEVKAYIAEITAAKVAYMQQLITIDNSVSGGLVQSMFGE